MAEQEIVEGNSLQIGSDLDDATSAWESELSSENGDEPLEEQAEASTDESEELELDSEDVQDEEEDDEEEEVESNVQSFKVRSDGVDLDVTLDELISGYSRQSSFTKKSQSLAEDRKSFESEIAEARQLRSQAIEVLESAKTVQPQQAPKTPEYWQDLKDSDPMQFMLERDDMREAQMQGQMREQQISQLRSQEEQEQQANLEKYISSQRDQLSTLIPEWSNEKIASSERKAIVEYGKGVGFTDKELGEAYDSRAVATMRKAMLYDKLTQKRGTLKPNHRASMKAGSQSINPSSTSSKKASARLQKSGSVEDAQSVFYNMIRS
jgi:uncharacterized protein with PIN domain|tara:strand:- start:4037 stop:5005 length:969 start_codon:yes stop_codon:yes gene_type:complete